MEAAITDLAFLMWGVVCWGGSKIVHFLVVFRVLSDKLDGLLRVFLVLGACLD
jgi:hypothetical protein